MGVPSGYTSAQVVQAVPTGINSALVCVKAETAFTASSSITADNVFTSSYTNYVLRIRQQSSGNINTDLRLRVGGVSASGSNYNYQRIQASSTSVSGLRTNATAFNMEAVNGAFFTTQVIEFFAPALAEPTNLTLNSNQSNGAYTSSIFTIHQGNHTLSTAYDGFEFYPSSGTLTGTYTVYAYGKAV